MLKKWDVAPAPNDKNPGRHKLLIKGEMKDIFLIVKKLGSVCSRPEKTTGDYDFLIYLSKLEMDTMKKLKAVTAELGSASVSDRAPAPAAAAPAFSEPAPFETPAPKLKIEPAPAPAPAPAPQPAPAPAPAPQPAQHHPLPQNVPSMTGRMKRPEPAPAPAAAAPAAAAPAAAPATAIVRPASSVKAKWSMELPLIPTQSFQTLVAGSHNRFAHAAAMAVVENPGTIYNPLLLFGTPGTGKTHFVNSISYGLSSSIGQGSIFVTDGIKFSKGIELAVDEGGIAKLEEMISKIKVLIIDDVHLLMVSDKNRKYLTKWLNDFVAQSRQIVVTSVFPPKSLSGLEDAVGFQFTQGWMVDLKMPSSQSYKAILSQIMQGMDVKLSEADITSHFANDSVPFTDAARALAETKKLEKFTVNAMNAATHSQLLETLSGFGESAGTMPDEGDFSRAASWSPSAKDQWFRWGIFYPKGMKREADYALFSLHERAKELGMNTEWSQVFAEEYNSDELYGIPFHIGNLAAERKVNGAIILGPQPTSALGAQEAEFRHITSKILSSYMVKGAWLPCGGLKSKAAYARLLMDLV